MIVFITSIKHPQNSKSYDRVWELLNRTLTSVCNQINQDFNVIVICNRTLPLEDRCKTFEEHIEFIEVNFSPVSQSGYDGIRIDRGSKYIVGLIAAGKYNPEYIMFFDADDFVGNDISQYVNTHKGENGWVIDKGYLLVGKKLGREEAEFNMICGTSHILSYQLVMSQISLSLTEQSSQNEIIGLTDEYYLRFIIGSHRYIESYFNDKGTPLRSFPKYGAVYVMDTGENHSDFMGFSQKVKKFSQENARWPWSDISADQISYFNICFNN